MMLGRVIGGSLRGGIDVRVEGDVEDIRVGSYVVIDGRRQRFFGIITDVAVETIGKDLSSSPPDLSDDFMREVFIGSGTYARMKVSLHLAMGIGGGRLRVEPARTIPPYFSPVSLASDEDLEIIFGKEDREHFYIGSPLDMERKICLDLEKFISRSNGVFGKSGTGKTFFTRLVLAGIIQRDMAVSLIFDMHGEYGWKGIGEEGYEVKGLKQLFSSKVAVFTLDEESTRRKGIRPDFVVEIGYDEIEPEDMDVLRETLNLTDQAVEASYQLQREFGREWISRVFCLEEMGREEVREFLRERNIHEGTFGNLRRGLERIRRLPFIVERAREKAVPRILSYLDGGKSVVLEFGRYRDFLSYILVANLLTRRIYDIYRERTERALGGQGKFPKPLIITIEEAHKFLSRELSGKTIFGTIAREMRKFYTTLLVVDQRPSVIDEEVMSQLGTKAVYFLDNERDIDSVLAGAYPKTELKSLISRLDTKRQAVIFGHALPMPMPIITREYGPEFYSELGRYYEGEAEEIEKLFED